MERIVKRNIRGISVNVNIAEGNEVYLPQSIASNIKKEGISGITQAIFDKAGVNHIPLSVFIELTAGCNFSCPFCYIKEPDCFHSSLPSFDELEETLNYLVNQGMLYCTLSGGECLTHPDFRKIYTYLKKNGVLVTVFTNGYLIDDSILDLFSKYRPFKVEISLYGIDDETYRKTVNNSRIHAKQVYDNVLKLKQLGIDVCCKTLITSFTEGCIFAIEKWCNEHDVSFYSGFGLQRTYSGASRDMYLASEEMISYQRKKSNDAFYSDSYRTTLAVSEKSQVRNFDCVAGRTDVMISSKYVLYPCMQAVGIDGWGEPISFLGIKSAYEELVSKIQNEKNKPLQYCSGCEHHRLCQECYFTQFYHKDLFSHRKEYCSELSNICSSIPKTSC